MVEQGQTDFKAKVVAFLICLVLGMSLTSLATTVQLGADPVLVLITAVAVILAIRVFGPDRNEKLLAIVLGFLLGLALVLLVPDLNLRNLEPVQAVLIGMGLFLSFKV